MITYFVKHYVSNSFEDTKSFLLNNPNLETEYNIQNLTCFKETISDVSAVYKNRIFISYSFDNLLDQIILEIFDNFNNYLKINMFNYIRIDITTCVRCQDFFYLEYVANKKLKTISDYASQEIISSDPLSISIEDQQNYKSSTLEDASGNVKQKLERKCFSQSKNSDVILAEFNTFRESLVGVYTYYLYCSLINLYNNAENNNNNDDSGWGYNSFAERDLS
jgi:hypothetical protein